MYFFACIIITFKQTFTDVQEVSLAQKIVDYNPHPHPPKERERETERQRQRQRDRETDRQRDRETEREKRNLLVSKCSWSFQKRSVLMFSSFSSILLLVLFLILL